MLGILQKQLKSRIEQELKINVKKAEEITTAPSYAGYPTAEKNTTSLVDLTYKNTVRTEPEGLREIFGAISMNTSSDQPKINVMKETKTQGLISINLNFQVASQGKHVVLIPQLTAVIDGRNFKGANEAVKYGTFTVNALDGVPFNASMVSLSNEALFNCLRGPELMNGLLYVINRVKNKETELGYDKIWDLK